MKSSSASGYPTRPQFRLTSINNGADNTAFCNSGRGNMADGSTCTCICTGIGHNNTCGRGLGTCNGVRRSRGAYRNAGGSQMSTRDRSIRCEIQRRNDLNLPVGRPLRKPGRDQKHFSQDSCPMHGLGLQSPGIRPLLSRETCIFLPSWLGLHLRFWPPCQNYTKKT